MVRFNFLVRKFFAGYIYLYILTVSSTGLGFHIDEIVQAWNEMYEAKKLHKGVPSFRLEPLFRRRVSKIYHAFELV